MQHLNIDTLFLKETLLSLLNIHSPSGYTDQVVHFVGETLQRLGIGFNATRRGAIRANLQGNQGPLDRALAAHLDTLGAMVSSLKPNGRLAISPVGNWSSRFAEGARVTIYCDNKAAPCRGTVLPLKASGHIYGDEINRMPVDWDHVEVRVDAPCQNADDLAQFGILPGDIVAFDSTPEITPSGFINARHLDDKAGVAILLTLAKSVIDQHLKLPVDCHLIFTIFEEVGSGASAAVYGDVAEMVAIDQAPVGPGQNAIENGVTISMMDQSGPFDYHLSRKLANLCEKRGIDHTRDVYRYYRSDSASAVESGNDVRTALIGFGVDAAHGYERTHMDSLIAVTNLLGSYIQSDLTFHRDREEIGPLKDFPHQPARDIIQIKT